MKKRVRNISYTVMRQEGFNVEYVKNGVQEKIWYGIHNV
jgi:hypothetical protein